MNVWGFFSSEMDPPTETTHVQASLDDCKEQNITYWSSCGQVEKTRHWAATVLYAAPCRAVDEMAINQNFTWISQMKWK